MISCANCETARFLQITSSRIYFPEDDRVSELEEYYQCQMCSGTGHLQIWMEMGSKRTSIVGCIEETEDIPRAEI